MKKYIISTIASAVIVPGLGQAINQHFKKALILMGLVFVVFIGCVIKLYLAMMKVLPEIGGANMDVQEILNKLEASDMSTVSILMFILFIIWVYSIIDAFIYGLKIEKKRESES